MRDSAQSRVTAGMRGASWNEALLPDGMRTSVHALPTSDGAQVTGCLYGLGSERGIDEVGELQCRGPYTLREVIA